MKILKTLFGITLLLAISINLSAQNTSAQRFIDKTLKTDPVYKTAVVGILAVDDNDKVVAQWNKNFPLLTASTLKTVTTGVAMAYLGPDYKYKTQIAYSGEIKDGALNGNIHIIGGGDPTLGSQDTVAFAIDSIFGVWANAMIDESIPVSYAPFPSKDGKGIGTMSACVGYILGNTGDEKRMEASVEFLKYMLSEEIATKILEQTGQIPSNPNVEITEQNAGIRMNQAVECIKNAGLIIETPENLWDLSEKEEFAENVILFLQNRITEKEFRKRLSWM